MGDSSVVQCCFFLNLALKKNNACSHRVSCLSLREVENSEKQTPVFIESDLLIEKWEQIYSSCDISYLYSAWFSRTKLWGSFCYAHGLFLGVKANSIWVGRSSFLDHSLPRQQTSAWAFWFWMFPLAGWPFSTFFQFEETD